MKSLYQAEQEARKALNAWTAGAAAVGWVPGSMFALAAADLKIVKDIAKAFGVESYNIEEISAAVGATITGKIVAAEALSFIPVYGWAIKSGVAAAVTKTMGETMINYFKKRSPYS